MVVGILGVDQYIILWRDRFLKNALGEEAAIPLPLGVLPSVIHHGARNTPFRIVEIAFQSPVSLGDGAEQSGFQTGRIDISIFSDGRGVPHHLTGIGKNPFIAVFVFSRRLDIFAVDRRAQVVVDLVFIE